MMLFSATNRHSRTFRSWASTGFVVLAPLFFGVLARAQDAPASAKPRIVLSTEKIEKLIGQLGANDYRTREEATRQLMAVGAPAMELLAKAARSNDLEVSYRSVRLLEALLDDGEFQSRQRAADILESLSSRSPSAVSDMANDVLTIYRLTQQDRAIEKLEKLGAVIATDLPQLAPGTLQVTINATRWTGKSSDLEMLKQLPSLGWLRFIHVTVDNEVLKTLTELQPAPSPAPEAKPLGDQTAPNGKPVKLADGPAAQKQNPNDPAKPESKPAEKGLQPNTKAAAPVVATVRRGQSSRLYQMDLFGTGISEKSAGELASLMPNVKIDRRKGALLGVEGMPGMNTCGVTNVRPGTAAAEADIRPGDEIATFDGVPIHNFEEFTAQVSTKDPGDRVTIEVRRGEQTLTKELTLRRWEE